MAALHSSVEDTPASDNFSVENVSPSQLPSNRHLSFSDMMLFFPELCHSENVLLSKLLLKCRQDAIDLALEICGVPSPYNWNALVHDLPCVESLRSRGLGYDAIMTITNFLPKLSDEAECHVQVPGMFEDATLYADTIRKMDSPQDRACFFNIFEFVFGVVV